jgi:biopolymer transport protein ExbB
MNGFSEIATYFKTGGPFMYVNLVVAVLVLAILIDRFWVITRASGLNVRKFCDDLEARISRGDMAGALALSRQIGTPEGRVALELLTAPVADQAAADAAAGLVLPRLTKRLGYLSLMSNICTLLGLLGTISGLTTAFSGVGAADPAHRSAFLAAGIAEALHTTSFGLLIAVPTLVAHSYLSARVDGVMDQVDEVSARLLRVLDRRAGERLSSQGEAA